jgi:hypothetical protein
MGSAFCAEDDDAVVFCGLRARDLADPARRERLLQLAEERNIACPLAFMSEAGVAALTLVLLSLSYFPKFIPSLRGNTSKMCSRFLFFCILVRTS